MEARSKLELAGGIVLIFLGIIFVFGFGLDLQDLITDAIFILFGALLVRSAYSRSNREYSSNTRGQQRHRSGEKSGKRRKPS